MARLSPEWRRQNQFSRIGVETSFVVSSSERVFHLQGTYSDRSDAWANTARKRYYASMPLRTCAVTFTDSRGVRHTADVAAESLFAAAVLAIQILKRDGWITDAYRRRDEARSRGARADHAAHPHAVADSALAGWRDAEPQRAREEGPVASATNGWPRTIRTSAEVIGLHDSFTFAGSQPLRHNEADAHSVERLEPSAGRAIRLRERTQRAASSARGSDSGCWRSREGRHVGSRDRGSNHRYIKPSPAHEGETHRAACGTDQAVPTSVIARMRSASIFS